MTQSKKLNSLNTLTRVLFSISLLVTFLDVSNCQFSNNDKTCAIFFSRSEAQGSSFLLTDRDQSVNLGEDLRVSDEGWNVTNTIQVETGCQLQTCNETYFDGTCRSFEAGSHSLANFTEEIVSAQCICQKQCNCADVFVKKSSCGRAYLQRGCSTCDALYISLKSESEYFSEEYTDNVTAIILRKGCTLMTYKNVEFLGDEKIVDREFTENFNDTIRSYRCDCDGDMYVPKVKSPRPASYPELIDIPKSMNDVIKMLGTDAYKNHPGLHAAHTSYRNKRSSKNAYILVVGSVETGKSSAINLLFDNPNITKVGDELSATTDIHEFRIPVPIDELGVANSELRVIDTPGLRYTGNLTQDAKILATLDSYLSYHEELKNRLPNIILIFHKFPEPRFEQHFFKLIRAMDYFRKRITDKNYSNVIFVFSHLCWAVKRDKRRPERRLGIFQEIIEEYTSYPKPIHLVIAENKRTVIEYELPMLNGYYKLPNNESYPKNLFDKLDLITQKGRDMIGQGVFRTAFRNSNNFNVSRITVNLVDTIMDYNSVERYFGVQPYSYYYYLSPSQQSQEVNQILKRAFDHHLNGELRKRFSSSLSNVQIAMRRRNILKTENIPQDRDDVANLLSALEYDEATRIILEKGLGLSLPEFPTNVVAGFSYDVFRDKVLSTSPFQMTSLQYSDIGFLIPAALTFKIEQVDKLNFDIYKSKEAYLKIRQHLLGLEGNIIPLENFQATLKPGSNIRALSFKNYSCSLSVTREFRRFELIFNTGDLNKEFKDAVQALPSFNEIDHDNVNQWKVFFKNYGTHFVRSVYGGGAIQINLKSNKSIDHEFVEKLLHLLKFVDEMTNELPSSYNYNTTIFGESMEYSLKFVGGTPIKHTNNLTLLSMEKARSLFSNWKKSLKVNPAVLETEITLERISYAVKELGKNYTEMVDRAARIYFQPELESSFTSNISGPGFDRENTPLLLDIMNAVQLSEQLLNNLTVSMKKEETKIGHQKLQVEYEVEHGLRDKNILTAEKVRLTFESKYLEKLINIINKHKTCVTSGIYCWA